MSYGFETFNALGERTSWGDNRTLQLYEEMEFTQGSPWLNPGYYRPFVNYSLNGTSTGSSGTTILQGGIMYQQDATTVMQYPELSHIAKEDFYVHVFTDGSRKLTLNDPRLFRASMFSSCPAWGYRILDAGEKIAMSGHSSSALAASRSIAFDCSSTIVANTFKYMRVQIYIKGQI